MIPSWLYQMLARAVSLFSKSKQERILEEELDAHIELATEDNIRRGMTPEAARRDAILKFGSRDSAKELHRETRSLPFLENLLQDLVYGARQLRRNPLVTFTVIVTLAIAIAANTTVFSFANALLFRDPAGVADPARLVDIGVSQKGIGFAATSYPNYRDIAERTTTLEGVYAHPRFPNSMKLTMPGGAVERVFATEVSTNYFRVLGALPAAGRFFDASAGDTNSNADTVVLSYGFWTRRFNRDPRVLGQAVRLNESIVTVIGVASDGFNGTGIRHSDMWLPLRPNPARAAGYLLAGGRLKRGVSLEQAAAELNAIGRALQSDYPLDNQDKGIIPAPLSPLPGETRPIGGFLGLLMAIVVIVLAIACANVSGVLLARAVARRQEMAVRLAIGASRSRIVRQLLTETVLLFAGSAVAGLTLARILSSILVSQLPPLPFPVDLSMSLDIRVIVFALILSFSAALLSGLAPACQASKGEMVSALKNDSFGRLTLRKAFVFAQVALSLLLVAVGGLFVRALATARSIDPGFDPGGVEVASLDLSGTAYDKVTGANFARELVGRIRNIPNVEAATIATVLPGGFEGIGLGGIFVPGVTPPDGKPTFSATWNVIEPGYFATLRMTLLEGRDFNVDDRSGTQPVVILGEGAARKFWPGESVVGRYIELWGWGAGPRMQIQKRLLVAGVVRDPKFGSLVDGTTGIYAYLPLQQEHMQIWTLVAARSRDGRRLTEEIRGAVAAMDANATIASTQTAEEYASLGLAPWRIAASVTGSLGIVGLLLAAIGIYGVTAYMVTQRTREIGIRIALGARQSNVVGIVLKEGMTVVAAGVAAGLIFAAAAGRLLVSFLFGVSAADPVVFSSAIVLFAIIGSLACYIPARRATRIDPIGALRNE